MRRSDRIGKHGSSSFWRRPERQRIGRHRKSARSGNCATRRLPKIYSREPTEWRHGQSGYRQAPDGLDLPEIAGSRRSPPANQGGAREFLHQFTNSGATGRPPATVVRFDLTNVRCRAEPRGLSTSNLGQAAIRRPSACRPMIEKTRRMDLKKECGSSTIPGSRSCPVRAAWRLHQADSERPPSRRMRDSAGTGILRRALRPGPSVNGSCPAVAILTTGRIRARKQQD